MKTLRFLFLPLMLLSLASAAWAQNSINLGNILSNRTYNTNAPGKIKTITRLGNGSIQLSFTNASASDAVFPVLATANLTQSVSNWTPIGFITESPVGSGQFPFTDNQATNYPQRYYRVRSP